MENQLIRALIMVDDFNDHENMQNAFSALVIGRSGWFKNVDEEEWYFDPQKANEAVTDQTTEFSEAEIVYPESTEETDKYFEPVMVELHKLLDNNPQWEYVGVEGWIFKA